MKKVDQKKQAYVPAKVIFEGGGIRRGLTPPEAAALLERPFNHIMALIFIGLLEKGFVKCSSIDPIKIQVSDEMKTRGISLNIAERAAIRRQGAQTLSKVIYRYEEPIMELLEQYEGKDIKKVGFGIAKKPIIQIFTERLHGYDLELTKQYYQDIINRSKAVIAGEIDQNETEPVKKSYILWPLVDNEWPDFFSKIGFEYNPQWLPHISDNQRYEFARFVSQLLGSLNG